MKLIDEMVDVAMRTDFRNNAAQVTTAIVDNTAEIATLSARVSAIQEAIRIGAADVIDVAPVMRSLRADIRALELEQASSVGQSAAQRSAAEMDKAAVWADTTAAGMPARRLLLRLAVGSVLVSRVPEGMSKAKGGPGRDKAAADAVAIIPA